MTRYVAFLRAINVGGRRVKMDALRALFGDMGFTEVSTFIASGNVLFTSGARDTAPLAVRIERQLGDALGYEVATMLRTPGQVADVVAAAPAHEGHALHIVFLERAPTGEEAARIMALGNEVDRFIVAGAELYWLCRGQLSNSTVTAVRLERAAGMRGTARSISSLRKLLGVAGPPA